MARSVPKNITKSLERLCRSLTFRFTTIRLTLFRLTTFRFMTFRQLLSSVFVDKVLFTCVDNFVEILQKSFWYDRIRHAVLSMALLAWYRSSMIIDLVHWLRNVNMSSSKSIRNFQKPFLHIFAKRSPTVGVHTTTKHWFLVEPKKRRKTIQIKTDYCTSALSIKKSVTMKKNWKFKCTKSIINHRKVRDL